MRISDWSSDVCSSDLARLLHDSIDGRKAKARPLAHFLGGEERLEDVGENIGRYSGSRVGDLQRRIVGGRQDIRAQPPGVGGRHGEGGDRQLAPRSEEHTPELQSLMSISYAVFCC